MIKTILIEGMMCDHCRKRVEAALKEKAETVSVSLEDKKAVLANSKLTDNEITDVINNLGFEVLGIENE